MSSLKGWRTIAIGFAIAVLPSALSYLGGVDWTKVVSPDVATMISGALMIGLRAITTTPVGKA